MKYLLLLSILFASSAFADEFEDIFSRAEAGDSSAQIVLGDKYAKGDGVLEDNNEAVKWYRLAAEQGLAIAQNRLGLMYELGDGVTGDYKEAFKWYRLAAEQGYDVAQHNLGYLYGLGNGVLQDYIRAHMWFNIASVSGLEEARKARKTFANKMTPSQIEQAQKMAQVCLSSDYADC